MRGRGRASGIRVAGLALLCGCLASGCVSLQQDGTVTKAKEEDAGASQVQIWASPPSADEQPSGIVSGFLEAARGGASNQAIAAKYLTPDTKKTWQGEQNTVIVLADYSESTPQDPAFAGQQEGPNDPDGGVGSDTGSGAGAATVVEQVQGTVLGQLDANGFYAAGSKSATYSFTLQLTKAGYRISHLPENFGVLMERSDFEGFYSRHAVYYDNPQQAGKLIPAEVYLPSVDTDQQVAEQVAKLVVNGVPDGFAAQMQDAVVGASYQSLQIDSSGTATVRIKSNGICARTLASCDQLGRQLAQTLGGLSTKITSVAVADVSSNRTTSTADPIPGLSDYGLGSVLRSDGSRVFWAISPTHTLETLNSSGQVVVKNVLPDDRTLFHSVTAEPGSPLVGGLPRLALTSQDQSTLFVPQRQNGVEHLLTVYPTAGSAATGGKVGRASWDSDGNLWFTVTLNGDVSVYRYDGTSLDQVTAILPAGTGTIDEVQPAPDGDLVAVRYTAPSGVQSIVVAAVSQTDDTYALNLNQPEVVASSWNSITDFDWYNEDSLAVLGMQPGSQELGLYQVYSDGSAVYDSLTSQPVQASPPSQAGSFVWAADGPPIASSPIQGKDTLYTLSVEGQDAQPLSSLFGSSPTY
ncbi:MAG TPA: LpqB family beta-propeller domain-containing protein [Actinospica sp.]|nr:LpqB family beta-propeller domain-containing protein [Actinospica sp.]